MATRHMYAILTKETTKDSVNDTLIQGIYETLDNAVYAVNSLIRVYVTEYLSDEEWETMPTFKTDQVQKIMKENQLYTEVHQLINLKSKDEPQDDEDGEWGNLRIYIQKIQMK